MVREPDATMQPAPQNIQLMSKHRVLGLKPQLRLEWRGQGGQKETEQPDHSASLGDSITASHSDEVFGTHRCRAMKLETIDLRTLGEKWVQQQSADDPSLLGLGDLVLKDKERIQPRAGRLDLLLQDPDSEAVRN